MTTLDIVNPVDESTVLFSLHDPTGANSGLYGSVTTKLAADFDLGSPTLQSTTVAPQDLDATYSAFAKRATANMKGKLILQGASADSLTLATGTLAQYLTQGCVMRYVLGTAVYLLDVLPSATPALMAGGELALYRVGALFQTDIALNLQRQPYMRMAGLTASANVLANSTMLRDSNVDGTPDSWTKTSTPTLTIDPAQESLHVVAGAATRGVYQASAAASASSGQTWTASAEFKVASGTAAIRLDWRTAADANISTTTQTTTVAGWTRVSVSGTAPATTDHIRLLIESSGAASTFDVRRVMLNLSSTVDPYRVKGELVYLDPATTGNAKMLPVFNPGTAPAPMTITAAFPDASTNVEALDYFLATTDNIPGNHALADYLNGPYYAQAEANGNGWTLAAGVDTTLAGAADATASPGSGTSVARITHATDPTTYNKRITFSRSTLLDAMRGTHRVFARVKPATVAKFRMQLKWSAGGTTTETNDEFLLDQSLNSAVSWALCDLGTIDLPVATAVTMSQMTLELWSRMGAAGTAVNLDVDYLMFVPQALAAHAQVAGEGLSVHTITDGQDLQVPKDLGAGDPTWVAGAAHGDSMRLDAINEAAGVGSTTTGAWTGVSGGRHEVYINASRKNFIGTIHVEIANLTDNTVTTTYTYASSTANSGGIRQKMIVTDVAGKVYQPRLTVTAYTSGKVDVLAVDDNAITSIAQNNQVRSDPGSTSLARYAIERLDSSSYYVAALEADRVPFWVSPGLSLLWIESYDVGVGGVELPHFNARTITLTPTVYPRWWA